MNVIIVHWCVTVNEVNKECIQESEKGGANEKHVVDAASL
jgi:hypothetical protein